MSEADRRAEALQALLERLESGESLEAVRRESGADADTDALLALAAQVSVLAPTRAPAAFRSRVQADLQGRMGRSRPAPRGFFLRLAPRLVSAALALALVFASAVAASADSLPGQALYTVKRAVEDTRLVLATNPSARASLRIELAGVRAAEVRRLIDRGVSIDGDVLDDLIASQKAALADARATGDPDLAAAARAAAESGSAVALAAAERVADEERPAAQQTARAWRDAVVPVSASPTPTTPPRPTAVPTDAPTATDAAAEAPDTPTASQVPVRPTLVPTPTAAPTDSPSEIATREPEPLPTVQPPTATEPPTQEIEPTALPTLNRATERAATQTAPTPTPAVRWPRARPTEEPPPPPAESPPQLPRDPRRARDLPPAMPTALP